MGNLLKREGLLAKVDLEKVQVLLNEEGDYVYVRQMTGHERDQFERSLMKPIRNPQGKTTGYEQSLEDFRAKFAVATMCDENGTLLLELKDAASLSKNISAERLVKIVDAAQKLNKITEEDKEEIIKNSGVGLADNFNSDSVEN